MCLMGEITLKNTPVFLITEGKDTRTFHILEASHHNLLSPDVDVYPQYGGENTSGADNVAAEGGERGRRWGRWDGARGNGAGTKRVRCRGEETCGRVGGPEYPCNRGESLRSEAKSR